MLEYSIYILGGALLAGASLILEFLLDVELHVSQVWSMGPSQFLSSYPLEGTLLIVAYAFYVLVAAVLMCAYNVPHVEATRIVAAMSGVTRQMRMIPGGGWIPRPDPTFPEAPVWHAAFDDAIRNSGDDRPLVLVRMQRGDTYYGEIASYPLAPDDQREKDSLIRKARYIAANRPGEQLDLSELPGGGAVLLNTADVDSIQIYYDPASSEDTLTRVRQP